MALVILLDNIQPMQPLTSCTVESAQLTSHFASVQFFVSSSEECMFKSHNSCTLLMAYDSALVIALYVVIQ